MLGQERIVRTLATIKAGDPDLARELDHDLELVRGSEQFREATVRSTEFLSDASQLSPESIVLRTGRPVLAINRDQIDLAAQIEDPESRVWAERLKEAAPLLDTAIRGVGRVELEGHPGFSWIGTGWLVSPDILVTNRHVAAEFTRRAGQGFQFAPGLGGKPMRASVDYLEEIGNSASRPVQLTHVLHIEPANGPDIAFFKVAADPKASPVRLAERVEADALVATIGYPARDSRVPETDLMDRIYGNVYDKKRLAPGKLTAFTDLELQHDCATLGGNSGSVIAHLGTGQAIGIHFAGIFLQSNFGVPAPVIAERLHTIEHGSGSISRPERNILSTLDVGAEGLSVIVPLHLTLKLGSVTLAPAAEGRTGTDDPV